MLECTTATAEGTNNHGRRLGRIRRGTNDSPRDHAETADALCALVPARDLRIAHGLRSNTPASTAQLGLCKLAVEHCAHTEGAKPRTYRRHHEVGRNPERAPAVDAVGRGEWRLYRQHSTESCGGRGKGKDGAWAGAQGIFGLCIELAFGDRDRPLFGPWTRSAQSPLESRFPARDEGGNPLPPLPSSKHAGTSSSAAVHPGPPP
ncbi:hypothetical protein C8Q77DRAFT_764474 [Trametes polyzona]|nr:hypothetical protein C8Q77DRAFT_764474 [Trametes polyzona]